MSTPSRPIAPAQDRRLLATGLLTALLLATAAVGSVVSAEDIASSALEGAGIGAMITAGVAFGMVDQSVRQLGSPPGASRMGIVSVGLLGLLWGMVRIGLGDPWIVPAMTGLLFVTLQAAFFTEPKDEDEEVSAEQAGGEQAADGETAEVETA